MNKINPLYLLALFAFAALVLVVQTNALEDRISRQAQENAATQKLGKKIMALKSDWKESAASAKKIDAVLGLRELSARVTSRERKGGVYKVVLSELNAREVDTLFAKLLNETLSVKSIDLVRNGDRNVSVTWEFSL